MESKSRNIKFIEKDSDIKHECRIDLKKSQKWSAEVAPITSGFETINKTVMNFLSKVDLTANIDEVMDAVLGIVISKVCSKGFNFEGFSDVPPVDRNEQLAKLHNIHEASKSPRKKIEDLGRRATGW